MNMFKIFDFEFYALIYQKKEEKEEWRGKIYDQDNCFCISCLFFIEICFYLLIQLVTHVLNFDILSQFLGNVHIFINLFIFVIL